MRHAPGFHGRAPELGRVEENFQTRAALESLGASLAARKIDPRGLDRLRELNDQMRALADDDPGYAELNREFHFTVYSCAGSPLLLSLMRLLWAALHGGPRVSRTHAESARQHDEILAALTEGDAAAASARTYQHIMAADPLKDLFEVGLQPDEGSHDVSDRDRRRRDAARRADRPGRATRVRARVRRRSP